MLLAVVTCADSFRASEMLTKDGTCTASEIRARKLIALPRAVMHM